MENADDEVRLSYAVRSGLGDVEGLAPSEVNRRLHTLWHELDAAADEAEASGDVRSAARRRSRRDEVASEFIRCNMPYARKLAGRWARVSPGHRDDYLAAAYEKLWAAFLSWQPSRGTFSTWARAHIEGGVRREVARQEFQGRSYEDFNARPVLAEARERLSEELGRAPSVDELRGVTGMPAADAEAFLQVVGRMVSSGAVPDAAGLAAAAGSSEKQAGRFLAAYVRLAERLGRAPTADEVAADTGMTREAVERALSPREAHLDAPVSEDGQVTLGDRVAADAADLVVLEDDAEWAEYLAEVVSPVSGQQLWTLLRLNGLDGAHPQKMRDIAAQIDVGRETVRRAEETGRRALGGPLPAPVL